MNPSIKIIFGLLGGLAIFIYGMNIMSESLQKVAGDKMKKILGLLTKNPIMGVLAGALVTAVLQSSSATTVMAISFVSAGLMNLPQAISIILGANIGTTITAQIIAFKISNYIYMFIFIGFVIWFVCKNQRGKNIGLTLLAFGLLFLGIETMSSVMKPLAKSSFFTDMIGQVAGVPVLGVLVGAFMTLVVQSSSATIAVLQNMAGQAGPDGVSSIIGLSGAIPILLGDNIGTTITALLASIGQSKNAKRTALAHCIFNISGTILFIWFVTPYSKIIQMISQKGAEIDVISRQIANAHTGFNIVMTLIWIPLIWLMVKIVMKIIPSRDEEIEINSNEYEPHYLDRKMINQPLPALNLVVKELIRCASLVSEMLKCIGENANGEAKKVYSKIFKLSQSAHALSLNINDYMALLFSEGSLTETQAANASEVLYVLCDIDRIAVLTGEIAENITGTKENGKRNKYSKEALKDLRKALLSLLDIYDTAIASLLHGENDKSSEISKKKDDIGKIVTKLRKGHTERISNGKCDVKMTVSYNSILHKIDRIGNCVINLSDSVSKQKIFQDLLLANKE